MSGTQADNVAGVILAGGKAVRMGGRRKGLLRIGGQSVIERLLGVFGRFFPEVVIAAREPEAYERFGVPVVQDRFAEHSSLSGIHAGLCGIRAQHAFVAACDAPFLHPGMIEVLLQALAPGVDVVIPRKNDQYLEPLCAIYSRRCRAPIEEQLSRGDCKIIRFFPQMNVVEVGEGAVRRADPDMLSFINTNTPGEIGRAVMLARNLSGV